MFRSYLIFNFVLLQIIGLNSQTVFSASRLHVLMDHNWKFILSDVQDANKISLDDNNWKSLNLPHDWSIEGAFKEDAPTKGEGGYLPAGTGWYRKHFKLDVNQKEQNVWIEFEGVYMNSEVWINEHYLGKHPYGYTSFYYDLTPYLKKGENLIAVKVDNSVQPNSRWYSGSGIYRHVWLNISNKVHIAQWGTYITSSITDTSKATIYISHTVENNFPIIKHIVLRSIVKNGSGKEIAAIETPVTLSPGSTSIFNQTIIINSPALWSIESPSLYSLHAIIEEGKQEKDYNVTTFGIRKIEFDKDKGFYLNGIHVKMKGVCLHHDAGCLGAAVPEQAWERRLHLLKEMGCNAIRTSHNPPNPEFLDLCDKMGFLVMDEAFDEWEIPKPEICCGYHLYFDFCSQSDLISMVLRDRNHPSVVIWSAGNEIVEQTTQKGTDVLHKLIETIHIEDPTRPVTVANDKIAADGAAADLSFLNLQDIIGYNYIDRWHERRELYNNADRHDHPGWRAIGTEDVSIYSIRGEYCTMNAKHELDQSVTFNYIPRLIRVEQLWKFVKLHDYFIGDFMWTGIDYLGESNWPEKNSSSGVIDLCGFPKDSYYFYQSQWTDMPVIHLLPHWNWVGHEGQIIPVVVFTNCESVELFLNGKSLGKKCYVFPQQGNSGTWNTYDQPFIRSVTSDLHLTWDVPFTPGVLKAIGFKNGKMIKEELSTTSVPAALRLIPDRKEIESNTRDIVNVTVEIIDENGLVVPDANNLLDFKLEGEGILAGTDNGNPLDTIPLKSNQRKAFNGMALAVIQATSHNGIIRLRVVSEGLKDAVLEINSIKSNGNEFFTN